MARLSHIGIAVTEPNRLARLLSVLGISQSHDETVPSEKVRTHFFPVDGTAANLELLEPTGPEGAIAKYLSRRGGGVHHLAFSLAPGTLADACQRIESEGFRLVYPSARPGACGSIVNFIHPESTGGVLIELVEVATGQGPPKAR